MSKYNHAIGIDFQIVTDRMDINTIPLNELKKAAIDRINSITEENKDVFEIWDTFIVD